LAIAASCSSVSGLPVSSSPCRPSLPGGQQAVGQEQQAVVQPGAGRRADQALEDQQLLDGVGDAHQEESGSPE
jgi:hypothetical protein